MRHSCFFETDDTIQIRSILFAILRRESTDASVEAINTVTRFEVDDGEKATSGIVKIVEHDRESKSRDTNAMPIFSKDD